MSFSFCLFFFPLRCLLPLLFFLYPNGRGAAMKAGTAWVARWARMAGAAGTGRTAGTAAAAGTAGAAETAWVAGCVFHVLLLWVLRSLLAFPA